LQIVVVFDVGFGARAVAQVAAGELQRRDCQ
jgi:hypothetical protein